MIYDCFSFFNELDILEIRLNTLNEVVDKFVLVEAPWTHTGQPKPLYFEENKARFAPFLDKIIHIVAKDPPVSSKATERENAWIRENWQRNQIARGLADAKPDDILIIADLDEIPDPEKLRKAACDLSGVLTFELKNYAYFLNYRNITHPIWTGGPQMLSMRTFADKETYKGAKFSEYVLAVANPLPSATLIRFLTPKKVVRNAGWHFSYMGGIEMVKRKMAAYAHTECAESTRNRSDEELIAALKTGISLVGTGNRFGAEPVKEIACHTINDCLAKYEPLLLPTDEHKWRKGRFARKALQFRTSALDFCSHLLAYVLPRQMHVFAHRIRLRLGL